MDGQDFRLKNQGSSYTTKVYVDSEQRKIKVKSAARRIQIKCFENVKKKIPAVLLV